ncbi:MAG: hypothetical protein JW785_07830 [Acidimicrobiia bacterium]|nr:hypothetical protein [Acidimicrobiia bacterium]
MALAAGGTWLAVSPASPLRSGTGGAIGDAVPGGGPVTVTQGALTVTAELHDVDFVWEGLWIPEAQRRGISPEGLTDPPIHAGTQPIVEVQVTADSAAVTGITPRVGDCNTSPLNLAAGETAAFSCYPPLPATVGRAVARVELDSSVGPVLVEIPFEVIEAAQLELVVTGPVQVESGRPLLVTGTLHNASRLVALEPSVAAGLCSVEVPVGGHPFRVLFPGETVPWSCDGGLAGLPGTYGPIEAWVSSGFAEGGDARWPASFTYTVTEAMSPTAEWEELCDLMQQKAQAGIAYADAYHKWEACQQGNRPGDPQCWDAPDGERYIDLWLSNHDLDRYSTLIAEKKLEIRLSWAQQQAFNCWCEPQLVVVLDVLDNGDLITGVDPDAVETYCTDGLPFGTQDSVPDG